MDGLKQKIKTELMLEDNLKILSNNLNKNFNFDELINISDLGQKERNFLNSTSNLITNNFNKFKEVTRQETFQFINDFQNNLEMMILSVPDRLLKMKMTDLKELIKIQSNEKIPNQIERTCLSNDNRKHIEDINTLNTVNRILFDLSNYHFNNENNKIIHQEEKILINNNQNFNSANKNILNNINPNSINYNEINITAKKNQNLPTITNNNSGLILNSSNKKKITPKIKKQKAYASDSETKLNLTPTFGNPTTKTKTNLEMNSQKKKIKSIDYSNSAYSDVQIKPKPISCQNRDIKIMNSIAKKYHSPSPHIRKNKPKENNNKMQTPQKYNRLNFK